MNRKLLKIYIDLLKFRGIIDVTTDGQFKVTIDDPHVTKIVDRSIVTMDLIMVTEWRNNIKTYESNYDNGIRSGLSRSWYARSGQLFEEYNYSQGALHGRQTGFWTDGTKEFEEFFKHGKRHGKRSSWWCGEKKRFEAYYCNGKAHGPWVEWDDYGDATSRMMYFNDQEIVSYHPGHVKNHRGVKNAR